MRAKTDSTHLVFPSGPHAITNRALHRFTSKVGRDPAHSTRYGDPFDLSGSSGRANGHHAHHGPHLKGRHRPHGTHPNRSHGVLLTPWGAWVPWATTLPPKPMQLLRLSSLGTCDQSHGTHSAHRAHRKEPAGTIHGAHPMRPMGPVGPRRCPTSPRNCCACHHWPHTTHPMGPISSGRAHRKEPADSMATMDLIRKGAMCHMGLIQMGRIG
jgi:hypothetical protein